MRFVISTYFNAKNYNIPAQRIEIKTNDLQMVFEVSRAFEIIFNSWILEFRENVKNFQKEFNHDLKGAKNV